MPLQFPYPYIVCVEAKSQTHNYQPLVDKLQTSPNWWRYINNVWLVFRYETLEELQNLLNPLILQDDRLLIMPAKGPAAGWLPMEAWDWINKYLPKEWGGPAPDYSWITSPQWVPSALVPESSISTPPAWRPPPQWRPPQS